MQIIQINSKTEKILVFAVIESLFFIRPLFAFSNAVVRNANVHGFCWWTNTGFNLHKSDKNRITGGKNVWQKAKTQWVGFLFFRSALIWSKLVIPLGFKCCYTTSYHITHTHTYLKNYDQLRCHSNIRSYCLHLHFTVNRTEHIRSLACSLAYLFRSMWCGLNLHRPSAGNVSIFIILWKRTQTITQALFCSLSLSAAAPLHLFLLVLSIPWTISTITPHSVECTEKHSDNGEMVFVRPLTI